MSPESQEVSYISNSQYENHGLVPLNIVATVERKIYWKISFIMPLLAAFLKQN